MPSDRKPSLILPVVVAAAIFGCGSVDYETVTFELPDDFHGGFVIVEDPHGASIAAKDGTYMVPVSASGTVRIRSVHFLRMMTIWTARRASGTAVPVRVAESADGVSLWSNGFGARHQQEPRFEYFVGTEEEFRKFDFAALHAD